MRIKAGLLCSVLAGCSSINDKIPLEADPTQIAIFFVGYDERKDRVALRNLTGVDPVRTEWCAAFVNAILNLEGIPGSDSVSDAPLMARSFLDWGEPVLREEIQRGDIVIFPRGSAGWQGHVGFYINTVIDKDGRQQWRILGGNQDNTVSYALYNPRTVIGIRRYKVRLYGMDIYE